VEFTSAGALEWQQQQRRGDCQSDAFSRSNTNSSSIRRQSAFLKQVELSKIINKFVWGIYRLIIMSRIKPDLELFGSSMHKCVSGKKYDKFIAELSCTSV